VLQTKNKLQTLNPSVYDGIAMICSVGKIRRLCTGFELVPQFFLLSLQLNGIFQKKKEGVIL